jgi:glycosyltransferase involved in cell wall biosynthesis
MIGYFSNYNPDKYPGVAKKVEGVVNSLNQEGFPAEVCFVDGSGILSTIKLSIMVINTHYETVIIRLSAPGAIFIFPAILIARLLGRKVVIDVPTPRAVYINELLNSKQAKINKVLKYILTYIAGGWSLLPANKILQYAPESFWFELLVKKKSLLIGNGIDLTTIPEELRPRFNPTQNITLIAVASISFWHGFDRVIKGIYEYYKNGGDKEIIFNIVGDGEGLEQLKELVGKYEIQGRVQFLGYKTGQELDGIYRESDIAIGSLGLHRLGLEYASPLKEREYCSRGLPFVASSKDPDFSQEQWFRFVVKADESNTSIVELINWHQENISKHDYNEIRYFAENVLSQKKKVLHYTFRETH